MTTAKTLEAVEVKATALNTSPQLAQKQLSSKDIETQQISIRGREGGLGVYVGDAGQCCW